MDAVVLAAGRNDRLKGYVPAYLKPLLLINGEPIIVTLCQNALRAADGDVVVVVAPQNAAQVVDVLSQRFVMDRFHFVVQPEAVGPADALKKAMTAVSTESVMILCGDNDVPLEDMQQAVTAMMGTGCNAVVCCSWLPREQARRFSRFDSGRYTLAEGEFGALETESKFLCWCGPVVVRTETLRSALASRAEGDLSLSSVFNDCRPLDGFHGSSRDIGVPEALT